MLEALDVGPQSCNLKDGSVFLGINKCREYFLKSMNAPLLSILCSALQIHDFPKLFFSFLICVDCFDMVGNPWVIGDVKIQFCEIFQGTLKCNKNHNTCHCIHFFHVNVFNYKT